MANGVEDDEEESPPTVEGHRARHYTLSGPAVHFPGEPDPAPDRASARAAASAMPSPLSILTGVTVLGVAGSTVGLVTVDADSRIATAAYVIAIAAGLLTLVAVAAAGSAYRRRRHVAIVAERIEAFVEMARAHPHHDWSAAVGRELTLGEDAFERALDTGGAEAERLVHALAGLHEIELRG
jgi:hypothetical protein